MCLHIQSTVLLVGLPGLKTHIPHRDWETPTLWSQSEALNTGESLQVCNWIRNDGTSLFYKKEILFTQVQRSHFIYRISSCNLNMWCFFDDILTFKKKNVCVCVCTYNTFRHTTIKKTTKDKKNNPHVYQMCKIQHKMHLNTPTDVIWPQAFLHASKVIS